jgi:TolB-like protein/Tfp pilus assembly protein PilF
MIGRTISRYHVVELLGAGGMGVVYKAKDTRLGRTVALKFISDAFAADPTALRQFQREAQTASSLNHPHICTVYQVDEFEGRPFIAMELLLGQTLKVRVTGGRLSALEVIDVAIQITDALDAAHEKGIVHRDVKPANIFITDRSIVKLLDFGLAKQSPVADFDQDASSGFTAAGRIFGTANYMSPERLLGHTIDHRSDLFSLGSVIYEMATGSQAFTGATAIEMIDAILHDTPPRDRGVPAALGRIIAKLLEKNADNRYQSSKALMSALLLARETVAADKGEGRARPATELLKASIAVLPFRNVGLDPANEYFCEGLAEELITALTKVEDVRVAARTSTFTFKGKDVDIREIGERLKVNAVLDGSVRKEGDRVRVSCQLLNTEDGYEIWSEQYDRTLADVFTLQEEITRAIVDKLKVSLAEHLRQSSRTENRSAYHHYLKGRFYWSKRYEGGLKAAMDEFQNAIREDPAYAAAYSGLADTLMFIGLYSLDRPRDMYARAETFIHKALSLDSRLPEAHTSLALIQLSAYWNWAASENEFLRAIELDPTHAPAHLYYSWLLTVAGRHWEAGVAAKRAQDIDPLSPLINSGVAWMYYNCREYDRAIEEANKCLEVDANFLVGLYVLGLAYAMKRQYADAAPLIERAVALSGRAPFYLGLLGLVYGEMGKRDKVDRIITELDELRAKGRYIPPHCYVYIYAGLRDFDRALEWQEIACEDGAPPFYFIAPATECLHRDARHIAQVARMSART